LQAQAAGALADELVHAVLDQTEGRRWQQTGQHRELIFRRHRVNDHAADRNQHADCREQRQGCIECAARGGERNPVGGARAQCAAE
jgi:hypothetical protein